MYITKYEKPEHAILVKHTSKLDLYKWLWFKGGFKEWAVSNPDENYYLNMDIPEEFEMKLTKAGTETNLLHSLEEDFAELGNYYNEINDSVNLTVLSKENFGDGNDLIYLFQVISTDNTEVSLVLIKGTYSSWDSSEFYAVEPVELIPVALFEVSCTA